MVYGSIIGKIFEGHIIFGNGESFTIEKASKYFEINKRPKSFHSIIYHDSEINHKNFFIPKRTKRNAKNESDNINQQVNGGGCGLTDKLNEQMKRVEDSVIFNENINYQSYQQQQQQHSYNNNKSKFVSFPFRFKIFF